MKYLFITGWQRSGTTLLTKILNAHPEMAIVSQPFFIFFKLASTKFYEDILNIPFDKGSPMEDCFLQEQSIKKLFYERLHKLYFTKDEIEEIRSWIINYNQKEPEISAPLIIPYLGELEEGNILKVFKNLMEIVNKAYGNEKTKVVGVKELYCEHFINALADYYNHEMKNLIIYRDPRAVFASRNSGKYLETAGSKYSLLFIVRNWRKSVAYHIYYSNREDYFGIRYEDLVNNSTQYIKKLCDFIGVEYSSSMVEPSNYLNGYNNKWKPNSSYQRKDKIFSDSITQWQKYLDKETVQAIESLCESEMQYLQYEMTTKELNKEKTLLMYNEDLNNIRDWQIKNSYILNTSEIQKEIVRNYLLKTKHDYSDSEALINSFFIFSSVYRGLRGERY